MGRPPAAHNMAFPSPIFRQTFSEVICDQLSGNYNHENVAEFVPLLNLGWRMEPELMGSIEKSYYLMCRIECGWCCRGDL